jgi:hypothetical protein
VLEAVDSSSKSVGGLPRETVDTGILCAIAISDTEAAIKLAKLTKSLVSYANPLARQPAHVS